MQKSELPELSLRLAQLADALGGRAPSPAGLVVWLDTLAECAMPDVLGVLTDWPKANAKMPLPADVLRLARERLSARVERTNAENAKANRAAWSPEQLRGDPNSDAYRAFRAALASLKRRPKPNGKAWAERLRERELSGSGEPLNSAQRQNWRAALGVRDAVTAESEAEIEARLEREAIQADA